MTRARSPNQVLTHAARARCRARRARRALVRATRTRYPENLRDKWLTLPIMVLHLTRCLRTLRARLQSTSGGRARRARRALVRAIMVLENSKLVKMTVPHIAPWLPMRLSRNTLVLKLFPKNWFSTLGLLDDARK